MSKEIDDILSVIDKSNPYASFLLLKTQDSSTVSSDSNLSIIACKLEPLPDISTAILNLLIKFRHIRLVIRSVLFLEFFQWFLQTKIDSRSFGYMFTNVDPVHMYIYI